MQAQGCQRQVADRQGRPVPSLILEPSPLAAAQAAGAQVRCQAPPLAHSTRGSVETAHTRPLSTRPPELAPCHPDPALAPPTRPLPSTPLPCAVWRAQIGLPLALRRRPRAWGCDFRARVGPDLDADLQSQAISECKFAPSHPTARRVATRAHRANAVLRRPAEAEWLRARRSLFEWPRLISIHLTTRANGAFVLWLFCGPVP